MMPEATAPGRSDAGRRHARLLWDADARGLPIKREAMPQAGPFGFEQGMTVEALERASGPLRPGVRPHVYHAARAPEPHGAFESYGLVVSPDLGLVRVIAVGRLLHTDRFGTQLRREFESVRDALSKAYGAGRTFDRVLDPRRKHPSEFVDALLLKGRVLGTLWTRDALLPPGVPLALVKLPPDVESILLTARARGRERGCVAVRCDFSAYRDFAAPDGTPPEPSST